MSIPPSRPPLFRQIADALRQDLAAGRYAVGEKLPPIRHLAKHHCCSLTAVQGALRELVAEGLAASDSTRGVWVKALPTTAAPTGRVICIFPKWDSLQEESFAAQFLLGASLAGTACGFTVEPVTFGAPEELAPILDGLCRHPPAGVVWANPYSPVPLTRLRQAGVRLVTAIRHYDDAPGPYTRDDFEALIPEILDELIARGAETLAVLASGTGDDTYEPMLQTLLRAARERGLKTSARLICRARIPGLDEHATAVLLNDFIDAIQPATAIYSFAPDILAKALRAAAQKGRDLHPECILATHSIRTHPQIQVDLVIESNVRVHGEQTVRMIRDWLHHAPPPDIQKIRPALRLQTSDFRPLTSDLCPLPPAPPLPAEPDNTRCDNRC